MPVYAQSPTRSLPGKTKTVQSHDDVTARPRRSATPSSKTSIKSVRNSTAKITQPGHKDLSMRTASSSQDTNQTSTLKGELNRPRAIGSQPHVCKQRTGTDRHPRVTSPPSPRRAAKCPGDPEHSRLHKFSKIPRAKMAAPFAISCTPKDSQECAAGSKHEEGIHEKFAKMLMNKEDDMTNIDELLNLTDINSGMTKRTSKKLSKHKVDDMKRSLEQKKQLYKQMKQDMSLRQKKMLEVYTSMKNCSEVLCSAGERDAQLPPTEDVEITNLAEIDPQKLLYLCMPNRETDLRAIMNDLCKLPKNLVTICETTLQKRIDIVQWLNGIMKKNKNINAKELVCKVNDLSSENQHLYDVFSHVKRSFSGEVAELVSMIRNNLSEREDLIKRMKSLEKEVTFLQNVNDDILKQMMNLRNKNYKFNRSIIEELQAKLKEVNCKKAALQDKINFVEMQLCFSNEQKAGTEAMLEERVGEVCTLKENLKIVQSREQEHISEYENEIGHLRELTKARTSQINELNLSKRAVEDQNKCLINEMETMRRKHENQVEAIKNELNQIAERLHAEAAKNVEHETEINNYKADIEKYISDLKEKDMKIENLTAELDSHESVSESFNRRQQDLIKAYEKIFKFEGQLLSEDDAGSRDNICGQPEGTHCSCQEIDSCKLSQASFQSALIEQHNANITKLKENLEKKGKLCDRLEKLVVDLRKQLGLPYLDDPFTSEGLREICQTVVEQDIKLGKLNIQCQDLQAIGDGKKKDDANTLELMQSKMIKINRINFDLLEKNNQQEIIISRLREKIKETSDENSGIARKFNKISTANKQAQIALLKCEEIIKGLEKSVETLTSENNALTNKNSAYLKALSLLEDNKKSYEETLVNLDTLITGLESELAKTEIGDNLSVLSSNEDTFSDIISAEVHNSFDKDKILDSLGVLNLTQLSFTADKKKLRTHV